MISSTDPWAQYRAIESPPEHIDGRAQLAGYVLFPIPATATGQVAHGAVVAQAIERILHRFGDRLTLTYHDLLRSLCDDIRELHERYVSHDPRCPYHGFGPSGNVFAALHDRVDQPPGVDALRLWLFAALYTYGASPEVRGVQRYIERLSNYISSINEPIPAVDQFEEALAGDSKITRETANLLADTAGFTRNPARSLAIRSLEAISPRNRATRPDQKPSQANRAPDRPTKTLQQDDFQPADHQPDALVTRELAAPDSRLRFGAYLVPDTEASLSADEARLLFAELTNNLSRRVIDQDGLIDLVLALMLTTARSASTVIRALQNFRVDQDGQQYDDSIHLQLTGYYWISLRDREIEYSQADCEGDWQAAHQDQLFLPYPAALQTSIPAFLHSPAIPSAIKKTDFEKRLRHHAQVVPRLSQVRLQRVLPVLLYQVTGHPRTAQIVVGTNGFASAAPLSYYAPRLSTVASQYKDALDLADITVHVDHQYDGTRVGAPRGALNIESLRDLMSQAQRRVVNGRPKRWSLQGALKWHGDLMRHTALMFAAATAHRMGFSLSQFSLAHLVEFSDSGPGIAYLSDKRRRGDDRIVVLPQSVLAQIQSMAALMRRIRDELRVHLSEQARSAIQHLERALSGDAPLFFSLDPIDFSPRTLRPEDLVAHTQIPVDIHRLRHWFATRIEELGAPGCDIQQHMGHRHLGEPYDVTDPDSPYSLAQRLAPFIESYLEDLNLCPVAGYDEERPSDRDNPYSTVAQLARECASKEHAPDPRTSDTNDEDPANNVPVSVIQPTHLEAYRLTRSLETVLLRLVEDLGPLSGLDDAAASQMHQAALVLSVIWGVSTDPVRIKKLLSEGELRRVPNATHVAALFLPRSDHIHGIQLLSAAQATAFRVAHEGGVLHPSGEVALKALLTHPPARKVLGRGITLKSVCRTVSMARRLTTPATRAAWERGDLEATGPRCDRLLALVTGRRVAPQAASGPAEAASTTETRMQTQSVALSHYEAMRKAIGRWRSDCVPHRATAVINAADRLASESLAGSVPLLLARAIRHHMTAPKHRKKIRPSTTYQYVTQLTHAVELALSGHAGEDPREAAELILSEICADPKKQKPVAWVLRHNRDHPEDIPREVHAQLTEADELGVAFPRAGDPITGGESEWLLRFLAPNPSPQLPARPSPPDRVIHYALLLQFLYKLRTGELPTLTADAHLIGHHRSALWIHPRRQAWLKSLASKRLVTTIQEREARREITRTHECIHVTKKTQSLAAQDLLPVPPHGNSLDWQRNYHAHFAEAVQQLFQSDCLAPFRLHSYRHAYATQAGYDVHCDHFPSLTLDLPYKTSPTATVTRLSLRARYRYISRQLGHGHPSTTLMHYDHSIPLMTDVSHGWTGPTRRCLAALVKRSPGALSQAALRKRRAHQPEDAAIIDTLALAPLDADHRVSNYPAPTDGDPSHIGLSTTPSPDPNQADERLVQYLTTAISIREGWSIEEIARAQDRTIGQISHDRSYLQWLEQLLTLQFLRGAPQKRRSRTEPLIDLARPIAQLPRKDLHALGLELIAISSHAQAADIVRKYLPTAQTIPPIGRTRHHLLILAIQAYLTDG